jgi:hypothetical protein
MSLSLATLRRCFEGAVPSAISTCAPDGTPNVTKLSQVHYIDEGHVALTYQFFNKTRENVLRNPRATVEIVDPVTAAHYHLRVEYLRTETAGPLFENMKARLAAIASHTGMSKVFRLLGSDVYRVERIDALPGGEETVVAPRPALLSGLRACLVDLAAAPDLARLLDAALEGLERHCDIHHAMLLMLDPNRECLYTVASRGYAESGVGSEIHMGEGIIGVAARERTPIRIGYAVQEYRYVHAARKSFAASAGIALETEIPLPGLAHSGSQLAVPLTLGTRLVGVLYVESPNEQRFSYEDEDALVVLAGQLALAVELLSQSAEQPVDATATTVPPAAAKGAPVAIRHFAADHSVFVDNEYLIKGVAGAIAWKLLREHSETGRVEFTNRELRLDPSLKLPDIADNLEARLILLQRRLAERCPFIAIDKTGRGRFRLAVARPLQLMDVPER